MRRTYKIQLNSHQTRSAHGLDNPSDQDEMQRSRLKLSNGKQKKLIPIGKLNYSIEKNTFNFLNHLVQKQLIQILVFLKSLSP